MPCPFAPLADPTVMASCAGLMSALCGGFIAPPKVTLFVLAMGVVFASPFYYMVFNDMVSFDLPRNVFVTSAHVSSEALLAFRVFFFGAWCYTYYEQLLCKPPSIAIYKGRVMEVSGFKLFSSFTGQQFHWLMTYQVLTIYMTCSHLGYVNQIVPIPQMIPFAIFCFALPASVITTFITTYGLIPEERRLMLAGEDHSVDCFFHTYVLMKHNANSMFAVLELFLAGIPIGFEHYGVMTHYVIFFMFTQFILYKRYGVLFYWFMDYDTIDKWPYVYAGVATLLHVIYGITVLMYMFFTNTQKEFALAFCAVFFWATQAWVAYPGGKPPQCKDMSKKIDDPWLNENTKFGFLAHNLGFSERNLKYRLKEEKGAAPALGKDNTSFGTINAAFVGNGEGKKKK